MLDMKSILWLAYIILKVSVTYTLLVDLPESQEKKLLDNLFLDYDPSLRPVLNKEDAVVVTFGISLHQIVDVIEKEETIVCVLWLRQGWNNPLLAWNSSEYEGLTTTNVDPAMVWKPDIVMYTNTDSSFDGGMDKFKTRITVNSSGYHKWLAPVIIKSACKINVAAFPFDTQVCPLKFGSWTFDGFKLDIILEQSTGDFSKFITNGEWELDSIPAVRNVQYYVCCPEPYPDVTYKIIIKRRSLYFVFNMVIPCILIAALTGLSFFLPSDCGERIGLVITNLLALAMFLVLVADFLPSTSETIPLISRFFVCVLFADGLSIIVTCISLKCHFGANKLGEVPQWLRVVVFNYMARIIRYSNKRNTDDVSLDSRNDQRFDSREECSYKMTNDTVPARSRKQPQIECNQNEFTERARRNVMGFYPYDKIPRENQVQDRAMSTCSCSQTSQRDSTAHKTSVSVPRSISEISMENSESASEVGEHSRCTEYRDHTCFELMKNYMDSFIKKQEILIEKTERSILKSKEEEDELKKEEEWKEVGAVLDTFFIYVFFAIIVISAGVIFLPVVSRQEV